MADLGNRPSQTAAVDCPGVAHFTRGGRGLLRTSSHPQLESRVRTRADYLSSTSSCPDPAQPKRPEM